MNAESSNNLPVSRSWSVMRSRDARYVAAPDKPGGSIALVFVIIAIAAFYSLFVSW